MSEEEKKNDEEGEEKGASAAAVDYDDYNNIEGEGHGRIVVGLSRRSRRSRIYLGERLLCDAASSYDLCPPRGFLSYVTLGSRCTLRSVPISILAAHAGCGYNDRHPANEDEDDALLLMGEGYKPRSAERGSALITVLSDKP